MTTEQPPVVNDEAAGQYQIAIDGQRAFIQYEWSEGRIVYVHTEVPEALEGHGVASRLAKTALEDARTRRLTVIPLCPFVAGYIRGHHEYLPLVDPAYRAGVS